ncbi:MAG TPA: acetyl-CoA carboxylase carboxyl transferase subunit beta, partial [Opitutaceae bacterium]|nr:acetyl-CoA carboxylase carboxyl transferase subunit beta [Opitutaceae bacterium]
MPHFNKPQYPTSPRKKKDIPKGVWVKCPLSGEIVFNKDLESNQMVVPKSGYHFRISAPERLRHLLDPGSFAELAAD